MADEDLLTVLVMFRYEELSSFIILAKEKQNEKFQTRTSLITKKLVLLCKSN